MGVVGCFGVNVTTPCVAFWPPRGLAFIRSSIFQPQLTWVGFYMLGLLAKIFTRLSYHFMIMSESFLALEPNTSYSLVVPCLQAFCFG
jgi:integral membrane sensor domain MASE1